MVAIKSLAHFSIPVSDIEKSTRFYTEVVGCRRLMTVPRGDMVFLDAAGTCLILVKRPPPINPVQDSHGGVHHAFAVPHDEYAATLDHLRAHGVKIVFEEDRQGGVLNGPRAYFHDPDGAWRRKPARPRGQGAKPPAIAGKPACCCRYPERRRLPHARLRRPRRPGCGAAKRKWDGCLVVRRLGCVPQCGQGVNAVATTCSVPSGSQAIRSSRSGSPRKWRR
jgi:catechol 2,3-dioxygenase-like lactoylglutathione lyase family enzyme